MFFSRVKKNGSYWIDKNGNKWLSSNCSKCEAIANSISLKNCTNLINCSDCSYCTDCEECYGCTMCVSCTDCVRMHNCNRCSHCKDCVKCEKCRKCSNLLNAKDFIYNPEFYVTGDIGSKKSQTIFYFYGYKIYVACGDHYSDIRRFELRVKNMHGNNEFGQQYAREIEKARKLFFKR